MAKILVVDDDPALREMVIDAIGLTGHVALPAEDGYAALNVLRDQPIDLVISDINMPRMDGFELLTRIRQQGNEIPILLLTARDQKIDVTTGFKSGADDYVAKPFGIEELTLRIQALLRRSGKLDNQLQILTCGPVTINLQDYEVSKANGEKVTLSQTEFKLLAELIKSKGKVLGKAALLDRIWGFGYQSGATVLDTYISYLRKKLHDEDWQGIKTVRGVGFKIVEDGKD